MALQNNKVLSLDLSSDAKPRLKWTQELHQRFVDAVNHLGGAEKATPKSLMRVMDIDGLTLYHLKSHLQKYRLGKCQQSKTYHQNKEEENGENHKSQSTDKISIGAQEINDLQVAQALQTQMNVQKKLHEQLEVQRHLQLRIEAQGKYLQSVLRKAQETLSGYSSCSSEMEQVKAQLSQLASMVVGSGCPSSSLSVLTESYGSMSKNAINKTLSGHNAYSVESSLTSSDSSGSKEEIQTKHEDEKSYKRKRNPVMLSLMEMHPAKNNIDSDINQTGDRKRSQKKGGGLKNFDLNCKSVNEFDSGTKGLDLNCNGVELFSATFSV